MLSTCEGVDHPGNPQDAQTENKESIRRRPITSNQFSWRRPQGTLRLPRTEPECQADPREGTRILLLSLRRCRRVITLCCKTSLLPV